MTKRTLTLHNGTTLRVLHAMPEAVIREAMRYAFCDGHGALEAARRYLIPASTLRRWHERATMETPRSTTIGEYYKTERAA